VVSSICSRICVPQHVECDILELDPEVFADDLTASQDRHVFQHRLAAVAYPSASLSGYLVSLKKPPALLHPPSYQAAIFGPAAVGAAEN